MTLCSALESQQQSASENEAVAKEARQNAQIAAGAVDSNVRVIKEMRQKLIDLEHMHEEKVNLGALKPFTPPIGTIALTLMLWYKPARENLSGQLDITLIHSGPSILQIPPCSIEKHEPQPHIVCSFARLIRIGQELQTGVL